MNQRPIDKTLVNQRPIDQALLNQRPIHQTRVNQRPIDQALVNHRMINQMPIEQSGQSPIEEMRIESMSMNPTPLNHRTLNQMPINQMSINQRISQGPVDQMSMNQMPTQLIPINERPVVFIDQTLVNLRTINQMPIEHRPSDQSQIQQIRIEPMPMNQMLNEPMPSNQLPIEPMLSDRVPIQQMPIEAMANNRIPMNPKPMNQRPVNQVPIEQMPAEQLRIDQMPMNQMPQNHMFFDQRTMNERPINQFSFEQRPMYPMRRDQRPTNHMPMNHFPMHQSPMHPIPTNQIPMNQILMNQIPMNPMPMHQRPMHQRPINQIPVDLAPSSQSSSRRQSAEALKSIWKVMEGTILKRDFIPSSLKEDVAQTLIDVNHQNTSAKAQHLLELGVTQDSTLFGWFSWYLITSHIANSSIHHPYLTLLNQCEISSKCWHILLRTTIDCVKLLIPESEKHNIYKQELKHLGKFLGVLTLSRDKPLPQILFNLKGLLKESIYRGTMNCFVPLSCKILEGIQTSKVFLLPNPWTKAMLSVLADIHCITNLKSNLQFEIELLFKHLNVQLKDVKNKKSSHYTSDTSEKTHHTFKKKQYDECRNHYDTYQTCDNTDTLYKGEIHNSSQWSNDIVERAENLYPCMNRDCPSYIQSYIQKEDKKSIIPIRDQLTFALQNLSRLVVISPKLNQLMTESDWDVRWIHVAVQRGIEEMIGYMVERCSSVACKTTAAIVGQDFAMVDNTREIVTAGQRMAGTLAAALCAVSCENPLRMTIYTHAQNIIDKNVKNDKMNMIHLICEEISTNNLSLAKTVIEAAAMERATLCIQSLLMKNEKNKKNMKNEINRKNEENEINKKNEENEIISFFEKKVELKELSKLYIGFGGEDFSKKCFFDKNEFVIKNENFNKKFEYFYKNNEKKEGIFCIKIGDEILEKDIIFIAEFNNCLKYLGEELMEIYIKIQENYEKNIKINEMGSNPILTYMEGDTRLRYAYNFIRTITAYSQATTSQFEHANKRVVLVIGMLIQTLFSLHIQNHNISINHLYLEILLCIIRNLQLNWTCVEVENIFSYFLQKFEVSNQDESLIILEGFIRYEIIEININMCQQGHSRRYLYTENLYKKNVQKTEHPCCVNSFLKHFLSLSDWHREFAKKIYIKCVKELMICSADALPDGSSMAPHICIVDYALSPIIVNIHDMFIYSPAPAKNEFLNIENRRSYSPLMIKDDLESFWAQWLDNTYDNDTAILKKVSDNLLLKPLFIRVGIEMLTKHLNTSSVETAPILPIFYNLLCRLFVKQKKTSLVNLWKYEINKIDILTSILIETADCISENIGVNYTIFILALMEPILNIQNENITDLSLMTYINFLDALNPQRCPYFTFSWLRLLSNRNFLHLALNSFAGIRERLRGLFSPLFSFFFEVFPENVKYRSSCVKNLYFEIFNLMSQLVKDNTEFIIEYHSYFLRIIPMYCIQIRNVVASANTDLLPSFDISLLKENAPHVHIHPEFLILLQNNRIIEDIRRLFVQESIGDICKEIHNKLLIPDRNEAVKKNTKYNVWLVDCLVTYIGLVCMNTKKETQPKYAKIGFILLSTLSGMMDCDGRHVLLSLMLSQLRFPSNTTFLYSKYILHLFQNSKPIVMEQITRLLIEPLLLVHPTPWGLISTFVEYYSNPRYYAWGKSKMILNENGINFEGIISAVYQRFSCCEQV
eukprot:GHVL01035930.1.p1 GENE.GHVL01035930.1~~GHVL01035930.1.p1  ORF type:complete len:1687 (+),score=219.77 GHVL01035930.1:3-5063(+)